MESFPLFIANILCLGIGIKKVPLRNLYYICNGTMNYDVLLKHQLTNDFFNEDKENCS